MAPGFKKNLTHSDPMPSFVCDTCQETLKKAKLDTHAQRCKRATFSCVDCYQSFKNAVEYRAHTTCISEAEKYEKRPPRISIQTKKDTKQILDFEENASVVKSEQEKKSYKKRKLEKAEKHTEAKQRKKERRAERRRADKKKKRNE